MDTYCGTEYRVDDIEEVASVDIYADQEVVIFYPQHQYKRTDSSTWTELIGVPKWLS